MRLMFCSCKMCKYGRHRFGNREMIIRIKRSSRRKVKELIKAGLWDNIPLKVSVPYTD